MKRLQNSIGLRLSLMIAGVSAPSLKREEGQTFVEYAMILALIGVALTVTLTFLRDQIANAYTDIANKI
jgi:Flp pilus assembly pilin Flp